MWSQAHALYTVVHSEIGTIVGTVLCISCCTHRLPVKAFRFYGSGDRQGVWRLHQEQDYEDAKHNDITDLADSAALFALFPLCLSYGPLPQAILYIPGR